MERWLLPFDSSSFYKIGGVRLFGNNYFEMQWITANEIRQWPEHLKKHSEENVPVLLRKLIYASIEKEKILELDITGGDSIAYSGYDGYANLLKGNSFLPAGKIVFEIGTNKAITKKADDDYAARIKTPGAVNPSETTFIFVTPRLFSNSKEWANKKRKDKIWSDVRVINAPLFEQWLEECPAVGEWVAKELLLKFPLDVIGLNTFWNNKFPNDSDVKIHPQIVLGGRDYENKTLIERCSKKEATTVSSDSSNESMYFIVAALLNCDKPEEFTSRTIIVNSEQDISYFLSLKERLIIIPTYYNREIVDALIEAGHTVIFPTDNIRRPERYICIELSSIDERQFDNALELSGFNREKVRYLAGQSLRDINVLRYILEYDTIPLDWSEHEDVDILIPLVLLNSWDENYEIDKWAMQEMSKINYKDYISKVIARFNDKIIKKAGSKYYVAGPKLVFHVLKKILSDNYFENFKGIAINILTDVNPFVKMSANERFMAPYYGIRANCSINLKKGLCQTLNIISKSDILIDGIQAKFWVETVISEILQSDNTDLWKTLNDVIDMIAEASPIAFLNSLEHHLNSNPNAIEGVFVDKAIFFIFSEQYHTNLLRALEKTSWQDSYFDKSISCLLKLAQIDPGGSLSNRPINTLKNIYNPWVPQTYVKVNNRLRILSKLVDKFPKEIFEICFGILNYSETVFPNEKPYFEPDNVKVNPESFADMNMSQKGALEIINKIATIAEIDLISLIWSIHKVSNEIKLLIIQLITERANKGMIELWESIGRLISGELFKRHRSNKLNGNILDMIKKLYDSLSPEDSFIRVQRWFNDPDTYILYEHITQNEYEEYDEKIRHKIRVDIIRKLVESYGLDMFIKKSKQYKEQYYVGNSISDILHTEEEILKYFKANLGKNLNVLAVSGFTFRKVHNEGLEWAIKYFRKLLDLGFDDAYTIMSGIHTNVEVIDFIETQTDGDKDTFWRHCSALYPDATENQSKIILNGFKKNGRIHHFIYFLYLNRKKIDHETLLDGLLKFGNGSLKSTDNLQVNAFHVKCLLEDLQSREEKDIRSLLTLELMYYDLYFGYSKKMPNTINHALSTDPRFVVELLKLTFQPEKMDVMDQVANKNEMSIDLAIKMHKIWSSWVEFVDDKGDRIESISENLKEHILDSRELAKKNHRLSMMDSKFGEILAGLLINKDQTLNKDVMSILQDINAESMLSSFEARLYNGTSGVFFTAMDGGKTEINKASRYRRLADETRFEYSIVASCFERIAKNFERSALHWKLRSMEMKLDR